MPKRQRHKLVGVHEVRRRLASGEVVLYRYAWRGGPRIKSDPGTREYLLEFAELTKDRADVRREGLLSGLIYVYRHSAKFENLSEATKRSYNAALYEIEAEFGDMPLSGVAARGMRAEYLEWRDKFADTPRKADMLLTVLARVFAVGLDRELIDRNPLERVEKLSEGTRRDQIWTQAQVDAFKAVAGPKLSLAMELARWTGQRQADLLKMTWNAYDGTHIQLRQGKTKRLVRIKVSDALKATLDAQKKDAATILSTTRKKSWTSDGFRASWAKACERAGIKGVTFHDLRGTFVTLAYQNGASIKEIAEVTGHSERNAESIIRRHYLAGDGAVVKLQAGTSKQRKV